MSFFAQLLVLLALASASTASAARPHILMVVLDDIGRTDTGIYGKSNVPMPNIVKLAGEGAVLENFYTQPVCSPTRSSLLVGRYPFRIGMQHLTTQLPGMTAGIPLDTPTVAEQLKSVGYDTHAIGKWHCGYASFALTPTQRGFDTYLGYLQAQGDYFTHITALDPDADWTHKNVLDGLDFWENDKPLHSARGKYSLDLYDAEITRVLDTYAKKYDSKVKREDHPLFIYLAHQTVHIPLQPRKDEKERCGHIKHKVRNTYCSMLVELDDSLGKMVDQLKQHKLWENTLVLLTTDNGGMVNYSPKADGYPTAPASQGSNYPLRASKATLFDGGVRSTAFLSGGYIPKEFRGQRFTGLAHVVDFTATMLAAGGLFPLKREQLQLDGHDLFPLITNSGTGYQRTEIPINIIGKGEYFSAIRFGKYKVIVRDLLVIEEKGNPFPVTDFENIRGWFDENGDLKERATDSGNDILLFDLEQDVEERHDIAAKHPELVQYGLDLIKSYVTSGTFMEPQDAEKGVHPEAYPVLHGGVWRPFQTEKQWRRNFERQRKQAELGEQETTDGVYLKKIGNTVTMSATALVA